MSLPEFVPFSKLSRLKRDCVITEKLDGTNACIYIPPPDIELASNNGQTFKMLVGSRTRWIFPESDNFGFANWAYSNEDELLRLGPGQHFGEWWGGKIQRGYGLKEKKFTLFNTERWGESQDLPRCVSLVPILYHGPFSSTIVDETLAKLEKNGSYAAPGFMEPEGVVVYLKASRTLFKVTLKGDGHKWEEKKNEVPIEAPAPGGEV